MTYRHKLIVGAALLVGVAPVRAEPEARQFDLLCKGSTHMISEKGAFDRATNSHASVDLARMQFCWRGTAACTLFPVRGVADDKLKLRDEHSQDGDLVIDVDLASGSYVSDIHVHVAGIPDVKGHETGRCDKAQFTPLVPQPR